MLNGLRVKQAREIRKLTQTELAERLGISQSALAKFEADEKDWPEHSAQTLALQLGFPVSFFKQGVSPEFSLGSLLFRCRADLPAYEKNKIRHLAMIEFEICEKLAKGTRPIPLHFPSFSGTEPKEAAQITRATLGMPPDTPIPHLINKLERSGIFVFAVSDASDSFDAFSLWSDDEPRRPVIVINTNKPADRVRLNCAHELGHLVMHRSPRGNLVEMEKEAYAFAAEFLMPESSLKAEIKEPVSLIDLANLKPRWGVSIQALIRRAFDLEKITERQYRYLFEQISKLGWRKCEPVEFDIKPEKPRLLSKLAEMAFGTSLSPLKIANLVSIPPTMAEQILSAYATKTELPKYEYMEEDRTPPWDTPKPSNVISFSRRQYTFFLFLPNRYGQFQLTTDGLRAYVDAVEQTFGTDIDYAQLVKQYKSDETGNIARRYSPGDFVSAKKVTVTGNPDQEKISTSYVERQNLTMRMSMRRLTRLTNGFSKKWENFNKALALHFGFYNFCKVHQSIRVTPAMEAGITDHIWTIDELIGAL